MGTFTPNLKYDTRIQLEHRKWTAYHVMADAGLEFVINRKFSFFAQFGATRQLKVPENKPKFEFLSIDGGMAIWF